MTVTYLGQFAVGETLPGVTSAMDPLAVALQGADTAIRAASSALSDAVLSLDAAISALVTAKGSIRSIAVADYEIQLASISDNLAALTVQLTDPVSFTASLLTGLQQSITNVVSLVPPSLALTGQIAAMEAVKLVMEGKIDMVDGELAALDDVRVIIEGVIKVLGEVQATLTGLLSGIAAALLGYINLDRLFAAGGAYLFNASSTVANLGAELNTALGSTGMGGSVAITGPVLVVQSSNSAGVTAISGVFKTS